MNCKYCQDLLIDYLYGEIDPRDARIFEGHLEECEDCRRQFDELAGARSQLDLLNDPVPSNITLNRIIATARDTAEQRRPLWGLGWIKIAAAFCMLVVVGGVTVYQLRSGSISKDMMMAPPVGAHLETRVPEKKEVSARGSAISPETYEESEDALAGVPESPAEHDELDDESADKGAPENLAILAGETESVPLDQVTPEPMSAEIAAEALPEPTKPSAIAEKLEEAKPREAKAKKPTAMSAAPQPASIPPPPAPKAVSAEQAPQAAPGQPVSSGFRNAQPHSVAGGSSARTNDSYKSFNLPICPVDPELGFEALANGEYDKAVQIFDQVLEDLAPDDPKRAEIILGLGKALEAKENWARARDIYRQLENESPKYREVARQKLNELSDKK